MNGPDRRRALLRRLAEQRAPLKGGDLATDLGVSRQIIVQDVALLRAEGANIVATPGGYILLGVEERGVMKTVVTRHDEDRGMEEELRIMVGEGGTVVNVVVEHPLYGEITGNLMVSTQKDVTLFMEKARMEGGRPLSSLTGGVHLHTVEVRDEETWERILLRLREAGYLPDDV